MQLKSLHPKNSLRSVLLALLLFAAGITNLWAYYDFSAVAPSGQTLYFRIINSSIRNVCLTGPGNYWYGYSQPTGELVIPSIVEYNDTEYTVTLISDDTFNI